MQLSGFSALRNSWQLGIALALATALLAASFGAGMRVQAFREASVRAELALALARCRGGEADAAMARLERTNQTLDQNLNRLSGVAERKSATGERLAQLQERPREVPTRAECLADDDDAERMRILAGAPG